MNILDLHIHTTASDGSMSPFEIVEYAKQKHLKMIAITDHDTMDGLSTILKEDKDIIIIPGVELKANYNPEMHILGYFKKEDYFRMNKFLNNLKLERRERNFNIIKKLRELKMPINFDELYQNHNNVGRIHIANKMQELGYVKNVKEAFERYIGDDCVAYSKEKIISPEEAIKKIKKFNGIASLAHPIFLNKNLNDLEILLRELKSYGLDAVEVYYSEHDREYTEKLEILVKKLELKSTAGSDFHGSYKKNIDLSIGKGNLIIPKEIFDWMYKFFNSLL